MLFLIDSILYSYAQIFFSNRKWFGALVLATSFIIPDLGMMSLLGVIISNTTAYYLKFDETKIRSGFYGFNGILFGAASVYYFELNLFLLLIIPIFIIITFIISAVLENYFAAAFNLPGLSLPFVISVYIFVIFLSNYHFITFNHIKVVDDKFFSFLPEMLKGYFKSISLIVFQPSILAGILITLGILFFSRVMFVLSIVAFICNILFLNIIIPDQKDHLLILSGFNSILTAFALGGSLIIPSRKSFMLVIISTLLVVIFTAFFSKLLHTTNLPILVLPFNFLVLTTIYSLKFRKDQTELVLLYFAPGSPEENFYYHQNRKSRFERFKYFFPELPFFGEWFISQGQDGEYTHKDDWKYAFDFVVVDNNQKQYSNEGDNLNDYFCYKLPVASPLDGEVVKVVDSIPNNEIGKVNIDKNWGNTVVINHYEGLYSSVSHLEPSSVKVKIGDKVKRGDLIALCGNSGRSPYPHLHFQFQTSDKIGDKTYQFPFAHFLEKTEDGFILNNFTYPREKTVVQNIELHKTINNAFNFKFGDKIKFECETPDGKWTEEWEIKVDIYNTLYIESSRNAFAYIYPTKKVFYLSSFTGNKNSALHYFYLTATQVPLCYMQNLKWYDHYSVANFSGIFLRYFAELFLFAKDFISASSVAYYKELPEDSEEFVINNYISIKGSGLLAFFKKNFKGELNIDSDSNINHFTFFKNDVQIFSARLLKEEDKQ